MGRKLERLSQPVQVDKNNLYKVEQELKRLANQGETPSGRLPGMCIELDELR